MALEPKLKPAKEVIAPDPRLVSTIFGLKGDTKSYQYGKAIPIDAACATLLYGLELEIEKCQDGADWIIGGISCKEDNSLRDAGLEFVTEPMSISVLNTKLIEFFDKAKLDESHYSERCSIHVHANCRNLKIDQVATVAMLYQVFEHLLYRFVGQERDRNIFCVPWYETTLTYNVVNSLEGADHNRLKQWLKYTGLNLLPLYRFGTVEFRQMHGTCDRQRIINWCQLIGCLFEYARNNSMSEVKNQLVQLNSNSAYRGALEGVFRQWTDLLRFQDYEILLEEGVLNMKYSLLNAKDDVKLTKDSLYAMLDDFPAGGAFRAAPPPLRRRAALRVDAIDSVVVGQGGGFGWDEALNPQAQPQPQQEAQQWVVRFT